MNNIDSIIKEICKISVLNIGSIKRYNTIYRLHEESVAEHSLYVSYNVMMLCEILNIDSETKLRAIEMAIIHDIPESIVGDIPYSTKKMNPNISALLTYLECECVNKEMPEIADKYKEFVKNEEQNTIEGQLVKLADAISVVQYCELERKLGNMNEKIIDILNSSYVRVENRLEKLIRDLKEKEGK